MEGSFVVLSNMEICKYDYMSILISYFLECCFVKYAAIEQAEQAIGAFNSQYIFPGVSYHVFLAD